MEREKYALAPYLVVAAPAVVAAIVAFAAYVDRQVAPVADYVANVYRLEVPAREREAERLAAAQKQDVKR
jgi:hypothetical protein